MKKYFIKILEALAMILLVFSIVNVEFQNDTFFTIALGERTVKYSIEEIDELVWHDNLEFIHLRWLFDVIIYFIYSVFGFLGIYLFVIGIAVIQAYLIYKILIHITNRKKFAYIYTMFLIFINCSEFAARAQILSFFLFLLEFYCIERLLEEDKEIYFIILTIIPLILVNVHASVFPVYFVIFLPYIAEYLLSYIKFKEEGKIIIKRRNIEKLVILILVGICLGFCSPAREKAYSYMFNVMNDGISKVFINELQSLEIIYCVEYTSLFVIFFAIVGFTKTKIRVSDLLFIIGFGILALNTIRCLFFFLLIGGICIFRVINDCLDEYKITDFKYKKLDYIYIILLIFIMITCMIVISKNLKLDFVDTKLYPVDAANYILENIDIQNMRIFNNFNFGSYLEYRKIPAFVDSRSEMFTSKFNEKCTILQDWYNVYEAKVSYKKIFDKYEITHALLYNSEPITNFICYDEEWELIYQDDIFSLYERK